MNDELIEHDDFALLRALPKLLSAQEALRVLANLLEQALLCEDAAEQRRVVEMAYAAALTSRNIPAETR